MAQCLRLVCSLLLLSCLHVTRTAPVKVSFDTCKPSVLFYGVSWSCCQPKPQRPIVDFKLVHNSSGPVRIRKALQCLDQDELDVYKQKLTRAYELMRGLPADDPRSLQNQHMVHCTYSVGCIDNSDIGLDVHFGWLFLPFHRCYLYFHEQIMQSLLGDPTFTIHFWNWDNDGAPGPGRSIRKNACLKPGNKFPEIYADTTSPMFHPNRNWRASVPSLPVDLDFAVTSKSYNGTGQQQPDDVVIARNTEFLHSVMVVNSVNSRIFFGREYRVGDEMTPSNLWDGGGLMEMTAHGALHHWIGGDMASAPEAGRDPIFFAHHGNVDRLWDMWYRLGPARTYPLDPDFLDAEFLFYDGNADLVRVKVRDVLDSRALGYAYEQTNDASWNYGVEASEADDSSNSELFGSLLASKSKAVRS